MGVLSGIEGTVQSGAAAIARIADWTVDKTTSAPVKHASNTGGAPVVTAGNYDWNGSYNAFGPIPALEPGATFEFKGRFDATDDKGVSCAADAAIVEGVEINWQQESAELIRHTVNFAGNGALAGTGVTGDVMDTSAVEAHTSAGMLVKMCAAAAVPTLVELTDIRSVRFSMATDNKPYHSSTTGIVPGRKVGNFSAELAIDLYISDPQQVLELVDTAQFVALYTDAAKFWAIRSIWFTGVSGIGTPRETGDLIAVTLNGLFTSYADIGGTMTVGYIMDPDDAYWWGSAP